MCCSFFLAFDRLEKVLKKWQRSSTADPPLTGVVEWLLCSFCVSGEELVHSMYSFARPSEGCPQFELFMQSIVSFFLQGPTSC